MSSASDLPAEMIQAWVDAVSEGASTAILECLHTSSPMGWASLSDAEGGTRIALVMVVVGEQLCADVLEQLRAVGVQSCAVEPYDS